MSAQETPEAAGPTEEPRERLRLVSSDGTILHDVAAETAHMVERIAQLETQLADAERELRAKRATITKMGRDKAQERANCEHRDLIIDVYDEWRQMCKHPNSRLTADRFDAVLGIVETTHPRRYPREAFSRAIAGAAYDPYTDTMRNGKLIVYDDLEMICRGGKQFEVHMRKAPPDTEGKLFVT